MRAIEDSLQEITLKPEITHPLKAIRTGRANL